MKYLRELLIIFGILFVSNLIQSLTGIPMPGTVLGMILLLVLLLTGIVKLEMIENVTKFLLDHLTFFFIPGGVALISQIDLIKDEWLSLLIVIVAAAVLVIAVTGLTVQALKKVKEGAK